MSKSVSDPPHTAPAPPRPLLRFLGLTALAIFGFESAIMLLFGALPKLPDVVAALVDSTLLIGCALPLLYLWWFRPLQRALGQEAAARLAVEARALRDGLTQLPSRNAFAESTQRELELAAQKQLSFTLIVLDIRHFNQINRALGQRNGDSLLRQISARLRDGVACPELVTRLGSDVFGILLRGVGLERAAEATDRVHQLLEAPFSIENGPLDVEAHCGVAVFPEHGGDANLLLQRAEMALQRAKELGERVQVYQGEDGAPARRRLKLLGLLRAAIRRQELSLSYQPKLDLSTGRITGAEALLSWRNAELGMISPAEFIPLAEQTSLIKPITTWVFEQVVRQISVWNGAGLELCVAVNLSARNLTDESLPERVAELLSRWQVAPQSIIVEVTESAVMADPDRAAVVLERLCDIDVQLSLDDFGTGYSSLTYLRTVPASELKIDRTFVCDVLENPGNAAIVRAVIDLAHNLRLKVVAEGVESEAVLRRLHALGCDMMQGYHLSRPLPAAEFVEFLTRHAANLAAGPPSVPTVAQSNVIPISLAPIRSVRPPLRESLRSLRAAALPGPRSSYPSRH